MFACRILVVADYRHCSCSYSFVLATRSKADCSSVYPTERKFAWRAANSFFKFPYNFFHSHKIFPFICREKFLSSPFTNGATICISKGWTRGSTSSEKSSWSKSFALAVLAIIRLIETLRTQAGSVGQNSNFARRKPLVISRFI